MVLKIDNRNYTYTVSGVLNHSSCKKFLETIQRAFLEHDTIEINLGQLKITDREGVNALAKLHNEAISTGKKLNLIGLINGATSKSDSTNDAA